MSAVSSRCSRENSNSNNNNTSGKEREGIRKISIRDLTFPMGCFS